MKKYNKIVGTFKKTIAKLEKLNKECVVKDKELHTKIGVLEQERRMVVSEGDQASITADKLKAIFG